MNRLLSLLFFGMFLTSPDATAQEFVRIQNGQFVVGDQPYYFIGANFWIGMNLAVADSSGDRARLLRELDHLKALGVTNLRIMAGSEGPTDAPWRMQPPLMPEQGVYDPLVLNGLDFLLYEMRRREMRAVLCLTNYWMWSGGMAQFHAWNGGNPHIPYPQGTGTWWGYERYTERFYPNPKAVDAFRAHVRTMVERTNLYTQAPYSEDPTIMAWELANEPRGRYEQTAFQQWISETASLIKSLDPNHLVTLGSEGEAGVTGTNFLKDHSYESIDYATVHIWIENRRWYNPKKPATYDKAEAKALEVLQNHIELSKTLGKPLVLEEFGVGRDGGSHAPNTSTTFRDRFFRILFDQVVASKATNGPLAGANFWAWGGEGRPKTPEAYWQVGEDWIGDPPHEPQGWYSVYDRDISTLEVIAEYNRKLFGA